MVLLLVKKYAVKEMEFGQHIDVILESKQKSDNLTSESILNNMLNQ